MAWCEPTSGIRAVNWQWSSSTAWASRSTRFERKIRIYLNAHREGFAGSVICGIGRPPSLVLRARGGREPAGRPQISAPWEGAGGREGREGVRDPSACAGMWYEERARLSHLTRICERAECRIPLMGGEVGAGGPGEASGRSFSQVSVLSDGIRWYRPMLPRELLQILAKRRSRLRIPKAVRRKVQAGQLASFLAVLRPRWLPRTCRWAAAKVRTPRTSGIRER